MEMAQRSIDIVENADSYRVLAGAAATWMASKGLFGIITMLSKFQAWTDKALLLDPQNALALILSVQGQLNAPKLAGGDPEKALLRLKNQIQRDDLTDIERFWTLISLVQAHKKLKQEDQAEILCEEARRIFSNNSLLDECD